MMDIYVLHEGIEADSFLGVFSTIEKAKAGAALWVNDYMDEDGQPGIIWKRVTDEVMLGKCVYATNHFEYTRHYQIETARLDADDTDQENE